MAYRPPNGYQYIHFDDNHLKLHTNLGKSPWTVSLDRVDLCLKFFDDWEIPAVASNDINVHVRR